MQQDTDTITRRKVPKALPSSTANVATTNSDRDCNGSDKETCIAIASKFGDNTFDRVLTSNNLDEKWVITSGAPCNMLSP